VNFQHTGEQEAVRARARELADAAFRDRAARWDAAEEYPWDNVKDLVRAGFMGITIPKAYGGPGGSVLDVLLVVEEIARVCGVTARILVEGSLGVVGALTAYGTEAQKRRYFPWVLYAVCLCLLGACAGTPAPHLPASWPPAAAPDALEDAPGRSRLQVLVTYGELMSSHTAVRLIAADGTVVFWDPAGDYGRPDLDLDPRYGPFAVNVRRRGDLLLDPPDLATYLRFRWGLADTGVEVFEWDLQPAQADDLRNVLLGDPGRERRRFSTLTFPPFCTMAASEFLRRFGPPPLRLQGFYFLPSSLGRALYGQSPSRVLVFRPSRAPVAVTPGAPTVPDRGASGAGESVAGV
jgi:hypothetical protein